MSFFSKISNTQSTDQLNHIFPESVERKRMSLVFAGLSCLICLCLLAISAGISASEHWSSAFEKTYILELRPVAETTQEDQFDTAKTILENASFIDSFTPITPDEVKQLMKPWLGDELILNELPLSQLIKIVISSGDIRDSLKILKTDLSEIPGASIEGYHEAKSEYKSAAHAIKLISLSAALLLLIVTALVTAVSVESGVLDNKKIINILRLIGTENKLITRLFIRCILERALKGAFSGMILACAVLALISLLGAIEGLGITFVFASFVPGFDIIFMLATVPLTVVAVGYLAGRRTMKNLIKNFI